MSHRGTEVPWHSLAFTSGLLPLQMPKKLSLNDQGSEQATHFSVLGLDVWFLVLCPADPRARPPGSLEQVVSCILSAVQLPTCQVLAQGSRLRKSFLDSTEQRCSLPIPASFACLPVPGVVQFIHLLDGHCPPPPSECKLHESNGLVSLAHWSDLRASLSLWCMACSISQHRGNEQISGWMNTCANG